MLLSISWYDLRRVNKPIRRLGQPNNPQHLHVQQGHPGLLLSTGETPHWTTLSFIPVLIVNIFQEQLSETSLFLNNHRQFWLVRSKSSSGFGRKWSMYFYIQRTNTPRYLVKKCILYHNLIIYKMTGLKKVIFVTYTLLSLVTISLHSFYSSM